MRDVCVIGLGLIGGSVLRAAAANGRTVWGATSSESDAEEARALDFDASTDLAGALRRAAEADALVVLAMPLTAVDETLHLIAEHAPNVLLTDVVSVKTPVLRAVRRWAPEARYVGGHPMAGTTESGWAASDPELFRDKAWVVCVEDETELTLWAEVAKFVLALGAQVVPVSAWSHDEAVARISHLPHLLAAVLAAVGAEGGPLAMSLAAGSYGDGTRVAGTRPELVQAMTEGNREALLSVVDDALGRLGAARGSLASTGGLAKTVRAGFEGAETLSDWRALDRAALQLDLTAPDARQAMEGLGERGGRITSISGDQATAEVA